MKLRNVRLTRNWNKRRYIWFEIKRFHDFSFSELLENWTNIFHFKNVHSYIMLKKQKVLKT